MNLDTQNLPPEVAAYIRSLEQEKQRLEQRKQQLEQEKQLLEKQLVKMQSLNEQLVQMRKRMFGQSSESDTIILDLSGKFLPYPDNVLFTPGVFF